MKKLLSLLGLLWATLAPAAMKVSDYPNVSTMSNAYLIWLAAPGAPGTNFNIQWGQLNPIIQVQATNLVILATNGTITILRADLTNLVATATNNAVITATNAAKAQSTNTVLPYVTNLVTGATNNLLITATNTALAQGSNSVLPYVTNLVAAATNQMMTTNGGTFGGSVFDATGSSSAPASNQLATAGWVRSLLAGDGVWMYVTTNLSTVATNADATNVFEFSHVAPTYAFNRVYTGLTNNQYIGSVVCTNTFQQIQGPVAVNTYLAKGAAGTISIKPEIYYSYDQTNWYGDWDTGGQSVSTGTNLYSWIIDVPLTYSTNATGFYVQRRLKVASVTASASITLVGGTNGQSHTTIIGPNSAAGNAFLAANQTFTGSNYFSQPIVGSGESLLNAAGDKMGFGICPVGTILPWYNLGSLVTLPANWQLCDGSNITATNSPFYNYTTPALNTYTLGGFASVLYGDTVAGTALYAGGGFGHQHALEATLGISASALGSDYNVSQYGDNTDTYVDYPPGVTVIFIMRIY